MATAMRSHTESTRTPVEDALDLPGPDPTSLASWAAPLVDEVAG
jgi:hypothetical protein